MYVSSLITGIYRFVRMSQSNSVLLMQIAAKINVTNYSVQELSFLHPTRIKIHTPIQEHFENSQKQKPSVSGDTTCCTSTGTELASDAWAFLRERIKISSRGKRYYLKII